MYEPENDAFGPTFLIAFFVLLILVVAGAVSIYVRTWTPILIVTGLMILGVLILVVAAGIGLLAQALHDRSADVNRGDG